MDGENNGKNPMKMDDLGGKPLFSETSKFTLHNLIQLPKKSRREATLTSLVFTKRRSSELKLRPRLDSQSVLFFFGVQETEVFLTLGEGNQSKNRRVANAHFFFPLKMAFDWIPSHKKYTKSTKLDAKN